MIYSSSLCFVQPQWRDLYRKRKPLTVLQPAKIRLYFKCTRMHFSKELSCTFTVQTTHQCSCEPVQLHVHNSEGTSWTSPFLSQNSSCERRCSSFCTAAACQIPGRCWGACPRRGRASAWLWASLGCYRAHLKNGQFVLSPTGKWPIRKHRALSGKYTRQQEDWSAHYRQSPCIPQTASPAPAPAPQSTGRFWCPSYDKAEQE